MRLAPRRATICSLLLVALPLALALPAATQSADGRFHEAYWLEHEGDDAARALELYRAVAADGSLDAALRARADAAARGLAEELAARDLARLAPPHALAYVELDRPGDQLARLLDQLGLLGREGVVPREGLAISPRLVDGLLGLRGAAVALTGLRDDGQPSGVAILHPGDLEAARGLLETALPAGGTPVDPIGGFHAWSLEGEAFAVLTERLLLVGDDLLELEDVIGRLEGSGAPSLADDPQLARALQRERPGLLRFVVRAQPLLALYEPQITAVAAEEPAAAVLLDLLDLPSLVGLSGYLGVDDEGLALDLALDLAEGHRNLVFNLLRSPPIDARTLALVPAGTAFFAASASNPQAGVAPILRDSRGAPVVSLLDFGRELFGNLVDSALFGLPPGAGSTPGLPDVALVLRSNDAERSRAILELVLGTASQATGGSSRPSDERVAGWPVARWTIQGVPVLLAATGDKLVLSPSRLCVERALAARDGAGVGADPLFAGDLAGLDAGVIEVAGLAVGRAAAMARPFVPAHEWSQVEPYLGLVEDLRLWATGVHSDTRLALHLRLGGLPDLSGVAAQALAQQRGGSTARVEAQLARAQAEKAARAATQAASSRTTYGVNGDTPVQRVDPGGSREHHAQHGDIVEADSQTTELAQALQALGAFEAQAEAGDEAPAAPREPLPDDPALLKALFDAAVRAGDVPEAGRIGEKLVVVVEDARWLNNTGWALLTGKRHAGRFDAVARQLARRACELADYDNWYYLDTLALGEYRAGDFERAVELQEQAVQRAQGDPKEPGALERLDLFRAALKKKHGIVRL